MTVAFNNMPGVLRVPLFYAEINAGVPAYSGVSRLILLGRKLAGSVLPSLKPVNVGSSDPNYLAGRGSMLADQLAYARAHDKLGEIWVMDVGDPAGGAAATGAITLTGPATAAGLLVVYVAGERYSVPVAAADSAAAIATNLVGAIGRGYTRFNRRMGAPVTAAIDGVNPAKVVLTARHTGSEGNGLRVEQGLDGDEMDVPGVTVTIAPMSGGTGEVDLGAALAALGQIQFDWISGPYASAAQLNAARDFLSDATGTWSPTIDLDGHYLTAANGNLSVLTTLGATRNDRHATILGMLNMPHPTWSILAAVSGWVAFSKNLGRALTEALEIARPLQTLVLSGIRPPKDPNDRWGGDDLASLYNNGISALSVNADGTVAINRVLTTYRTNLYNQADDTFLSITSIAIGAYVKRYLRLKVTSTYPRHVLRSDNPGNLQGVVTPGQMQTTLSHAIRDLDETGGLIENSETIIEYMIVERSSDAGRLNAYVPVDMSDEFIALAANIPLFRTLTPDNASLL